MATFTKLHLSGSTDGRPIGITATATPGTTIHTATTTTGIDGYDEIYLWAGNVTNAAVNIGVSIGTVTEPHQTILVRVPAGFNGEIPVMPGYIYRNGLVITATAASAGVVALRGFVNRITGQSS